MNYWILFCKCAKLELIFQFWLLSHLKINKNWNRIFIFVQSKMRNIFLNKASLKSVRVSTGFVQGLYWFVLFFFTGFVSSSGWIHAEFVLGLSCIRAVFMLDSCLVCAGLYWFCTGFILWFLVCTRVFTRVCAGFVLAFYRFVTRTLLGFYWFCSGFVFSLLSKTP